MNPTTVADILRVITREPGRPRITWYGDDGERVELSGAVLENWVNKTVNLLVEEFDAEPGTRVLLDLPPHWRTLVWAFGVWRVGACLVTAGAEGDVVLTGEPSNHPDRAQLVAVAMPALARGFDGVLPSGAVDANRAVMTYGDQINWAPQPDPGAWALTDVTHEGLRGWAAPSTARDEGERVLWEPLAPGEPGVLDLLRCGLDTLARGGSLVAVAPSTSLAMREDAARRTRLMDTERITTEWRSYR